ncbi:hypothetical protein Bhyg_02009 [Pseudolycoriella hygida]|uniref:Uncharacterized protein n=1 Tax=Pseudolycoriella hygida TaxID=35572 RepID=A0A9Q0S853_9DIPT|nr:hypothetical protein Bhyg_02009 [Pseudolycoriella hygida]
MFNVKQNAKLEIKRK